MDVSVIHSGQSSLSPLALSSVAVDRGAVVQALLLQVADGDKDAFDQLYRQLSSAVFGLAKIVIRDPAQAEEVAQETFLQIWVEASRFDSSKGSALGWVMTLTRRRAIDRVRSAQSSRHRDMASYLTGFERDHDSASERFHQRQEIDQLRLSLQLLTRVQREALILAFFGGLTYQEVSITLGIPQGTAKTRIRDGLTRLREHFLTDDHPTALTQTSA